MTVTQLSFTRLLAAAAAGAQMPADITVDWAEYMRLARVQSLQPLLLAACQLLPQEQQPPEGVLAELKGVTKQAILLDARQSIEAGQILQRVKQEHIPVAVLKGPVIKALYARPEMRFMSDLDLWLLPQDRERLSALLDTLGYQPAEGSEEAFTKPGGLLLELHTEHYNAQQMPVWAAWLEELQKRAFQRPDCALLPQEHYIYLLLHFLGHFTSNGAGLRWVLDLWLMKERCSVNEDYLLSTCEALGIREFYEKLQRVIGVLFDGAASDALTDEIGAYILEGGNFGKRINTVSKSLARKGGKAGYLRRRLFPKRAELQERYPILRKAPVLLPLIWLIRGISALFYKREHIKDEWQTAKAADLSHAAYLKDFYKRTGAAAAIDNSKSHPAR